MLPRRLTFQSLNSLQTRFCEQNKWESHLAFYVVTPHIYQYMYVVCDNVMFACLSSGVYVFGFLFMLPQLFVNYKVSR